MTGPTERPDDGRMGAAAHGEGRRALIATLLGVALGLVAAIFARPETEARASRWRGRSAT